MNPKDPLNAAPSHQLFAALSKVATGFSANQVIEAAAVLQINAIRQSFATRAAAEMAFDEITAKAKQVLLSEHYDLGGRRRNVFPFPQTVQVSTVINPSKVKGL